MKIKRITETVQRCQRNYDLTEAIPREHQDYIIHCATQMPTRQQRIHYNITVVDDVALTREVYARYAYDKDDRDHDLRNGQTYAPLLLIFGTDSKMHSDPKYSYRQYDIPMSIGLSAGAAAMAAVELGYVTGFCKCFDEPQLEQWIESTYGRQCRDPRLMLGIGRSNDRFDRTECVIDDKVVYTASSMGDKEIEIIRR